jgi:hypothetical protein
LGDKIIESKGTIRARARARIWVSSIMKGKKKGKCLKNTKHKNE